MSEKKYVGIGKSTNYSKNCQINLNDLFKFIYESTNDKEIFKSFESLKKVLSNNELSYVYKYLDKKENKENFVLKISVSERKAPDKLNNDLSVSLNEFIAVKKEEPDIHITNNDDLPF
jgi:predicted transcriptional regulator